MFLFAQAQCGLERLQTIIQQGFACFQIAAHADSFLWFSSHKCNLIVHHVIDQHRRERLPSEVAQEMALDYLLGDGTDEVIHLFLFTY